MTIKPYYEQDGITLYLGDCREILPTLDIVDHVLTDPPYARDVYQRLGAPKSHDGSGTIKRLRGYEYSRPSQRKKGNVRTGIRNHQYSSISIEKLAAGAIGHIDEMLAQVALEIARLSKRWALVFSDFENAHTWRFALEDAGMRYVRAGAWFKPDPMPQFSGDRPAVGFEPCTICHAQGPMRWNGGGSAATWTHGTVKKDRPNHPCPKPLSLMCELVSLFSDPDELILDPFAGSGTTLIAAKKLGRHGIGIEVDEKFCEVAANRLRNQSREGLLSFTGVQEKLPA